MKKTSNTMIEDLNQLIDFSCEDSSQVDNLQEFHKMGIYIQYGTREEKHQSFRRLFLLV